MVKGFKDLVKFKDKMKCIFFSCRKISVQNLIPFGDQVDIFKETNPFNVSLQGKGDVLTSEKLIFDRTLY